MDANPGAASAVRHARGIVAYARIFGVPESQVDAAFAPRVGPVFAEEQLQAAGGAAWTDPALSGRDSSIAVITAVVAQGVTGDRLAAPLVLARQNGLGDDALTALTVFLAIYLGHARASLAMEIIHARVAARLSAAAGGAQETATVN
jgi:4-carboxymuconolactone decarboxylase